MVRENTSRFSNITEPDLGDFSDLERKVYDLISQSHKDNKTISNKDIAHTLGISRNKAAKIRISVVKKIGIKPGY